MGLFPPPENRSTRVGKLESCSQAERVAGRGGGGYFGAGKTAAIPEIVENKSTVFLAMTRRYTFHPKSMSAGFDIGSTNSGQPNLCSSPILGKLSLRVHMHTRQNLMQSSDTIPHSLDSSEAQAMALVSFPIIVLGSSDNCSARFRGAGSAATGGE